MTTDLDATDGADAASSADAEAVTHGVAEPAALEPVDAEPSFPALVAELAADVAVLVRQELTLAASEMARKGRIAAHSAMLVSVGVMLGAIALLVVIAAIVLALGSALPMWLAAALVAAAIGGAGFVAYRTGMSRLSDLELAPSETFASVREDTELAKQQLSATRVALSTTFDEVRRRITIPAAPAPESTPEPALEPAPEPAPAKKRRAPAKRKPRNPAPESKRGFDAHHRKAT